jgi:hypothetical protein
MAIGRKPEALQLARSRANDQPDDVNARIALGLLLYVARRCDQAREVFIEIALRSQSTWLSRVAGVCVDLAIGEADPAMAIMEVVSGETKMSKSGDGVFPGLLHMCQLRSGCLDEEIASAGIERAEEERIRDADRPYDEHTFIYERMWFWTPVQLAIGYLALGKTKAAIGALSRAVDQGDPLTVWLHLWPVFDPLRDNPAFQALIKRLNLPSLE